MLSLWKLLQHNARPQTTQAKNTPLRNTETPKNQTVRRTKKTEKRTEEAELTWFTSVLNVAKAFQQKKDFTNI